MVLKLSTATQKPVTLMVLPIPLRGMKLWTTEAGFRVCGIVRWPKGIKNAGQVVKHPVSALDFLPTFCKLAGIKTPADLELDGADFTAALDNNAVERKKPLVWAFYNALNGQQLANNWPCAMANGRLLLS